MHISQKCAAKKYTRKCEVQLHYITKVVHRGTLFAMMVKAYNVLFGSILNVLVLNANSKLYALQTHPQPNGLANFVLTDSKSALNCIMYIHTKTSILSNQ